MGEWQGSVLLSEVCTVQVLVGPKNLSTLQNTHFRSLDCTQTNVNAFGTKRSVRSIVDGCFLGVSSGQGFHCTSILLVHRIRNYTVSKIEHIMYVCGSKNSTDKMTALSAVFNPGLLWTWECDWEWSACLHAACPLPHSGGWRWETYQLNNHVVRSVINLAN